MSGSPKTWVRRTRLVWLTMSVWRRRWEPPPAIRPPARPCPPERPAVSQRPGLPERPGMPEQHGVPAAAPEPEPPRPPHLSHARQAPHPACPEAATVRRASPLRRAAGKAPRPGPAPPRLRQRPLPARPFWSSVPAFPAQATARRKGYGIGLAGAAHNANRGLTQGPIYGYMTCKGQGSGPLLCPWHNPACLHIQRLAACQRRYGPSPSFSFSGLHLPDLPARLVLHPVQREHLRRPGTNATAVLASIRQWNRDDHLPAVAWRGVSYRPLTCPAACPSSCLGNWVVAWSGAGQAAGWAGLQAASN